MRPGPAASALLAALLLGALLLAAVLLASSTGRALTVVDRTSGAGVEQIRVAADDGEPWVRLLDGNATLDGAELPSDEPVALPGDGEPWRGFPATWPVTLAGNGTVLLADEASGLALELTPRESPASNASTGSSSAGESGNRTPPTDGGELQAPTEGEPGALPDEDDVRTGAGTDAPGHTPAPGAHPETHAGSTVAPSNLLVAGTLGLLALVALVAGLWRPARLRIAQVGWLVRRLKTRWRHRKR